MTREGPEKSSVKLGFDRITGTAHVVSTSGLFLGTFLCLLGNSNFTEQVLAS